MTIQRQYFLPNCTLTLEGMSVASSELQDSFRPSLDMLMRFECNFAPLNQVISGGSDLLESLIAATNDCTQAWVSGIQRNRSKKQEDNIVQITPTDAGDFELSIPAQLLPEGTTTEPKVHLQLSPVQLFDLAEAFDQMLSDSQTLPSLSHRITPLSRSEALSDQPLARRAAPFLLGTFGFALSAAVLFLVPAPEVERPQIEPTPTEETTPGSEPATPTDGSAPPAPTPGEPDAANPSDSEPSNSSESPAASPKAE